MATLANDLVEECRRHLLSGQVEKVDRLDGAILAAATSLVLKYGANAPQTGPLLSLDLEEIRVWEYTPATKTADVVERGVNGTSAADHSDAALVTVQPKFSSFRILRALNEELYALGSPRNGLFQMKTVELTAAASTLGYDLTGVTNIDGIYAVEYKTLSGLAGDWRPLPTWDIARNENTTSFPSGFALFPVGGSIGQPIRVHYKAPFGQLAALADDVQTTTGLPVEANDIPPLGAAARLVGPREVKRNFTEAQGEPRRAEEVPAGATAGSQSWLSAMRKQRIADVASMLAERYPERRDYIDLSLSRRH